MRAYGTPVVINGKTGATPGPADTTIRRIAIPNPLRPSQSVVARRILFRHIAGAGDLLIRLPATPNETITLKATQTLEIDALCLFFHVAASVGTVEWEAVAFVAA